MSISKNGNGRWKAIETKQRQMEKLISTARRMNKEYYYYQGRRKWNLFANAEFICWSFGNSIRTGSFPDSEGVEIKDPTKSANDNFSRHTVNAVDITSPLYLRELQLSPQSRRRRVREWQIRSQFHCRPSSRRDCTDWFCLVWVVARPMLLLDSYP